MNNNEAIPNDCGKITQTPQDSPDGIRKEKFANKLESGK